MCDMIFVSMESWDEIWRRNQFVVAELARRFPTSRILFVGLPVNVSHDLRKGRIGDVLRAMSSSEPLTSPDGLPNVLLFHPTKWLPNTLTVGRAINRLFERRQLAAVSRKLGFDRPLLWLNPHYAVHLAGKLNASATLYDITDDWTSLTQREGLRKQVIAEDAELLVKANAVVVCSERLREMKKGRAKRLFLVPNGVEVERYRLISRQSPNDPEFAEAERALPVPKAASDWPRPVFGYTGTLHPDRVDVKLMVALAEAYPNGTVALIGPNHLTDDDRVALDRLPNVKVTGSVPYFELQSWMRAFDVCIVPHKVTPFTESLNPLKLFEYLAAGLPIVSTDVAGFRDYAAGSKQSNGEDLVYIAHGEEGSDRASAFLTACASALAERDSAPMASKLRDARQNAAAGESWGARVDKLLEIIGGIVDPGHEPGYSDYDEYAAPINAKPARRASPPSGKP